MSRRRPTLGRDVRQEVAKNALIGMDWRTVRARMILDVVVVPLRHTGRQQLRFAQHGERRRSHVDDGKYREQQAAEAGEPVHAWNVCRWKPVVNP